MNKKSNRFSPEVRERAVRLVQEHRGDYPSLWACIESIAPKIGCVPQTLNDWVKQQDIDTGTRDGLSAEERERIKSLEREVKELRRANDILKTDELIKISRNHALSALTCHLHSNEGNIACSSSSCFCYCAHRA